MRSPRRRRRSPWLALPPDKLGGSCGSDGCDCAGWNEATLESDPLAAGQLDAVSRAGSSVGINKRRTAGALDEQVVAGGVGGEQGSVGRASGQCPGGGCSLGGLNTIGNVGLDGCEQSLDVRQVGVNRHGSAGKRTKAFNNLIPLAAHYFVSIAS